MIDYCWLPDLVMREDYQDWNSYQEAIYDIFKRDFIESQPEYEGKRVQIRKNPRENGKEQAFLHITTNDYQKDRNRYPDFRRCERIKWARSFIENPSCENILCLDCDGIKVWEERKEGKKRIHLLLEEERYIVVIERRDDYYLLITAFYIEYDHTLRNKLKKYENFISKHAG